MGRSGWRRGRRRLRNSSLPWGDVDGQGFAGLRVKGGFVERGIVGSFDHVEREGRDVLETEMAGGICSGGKVERDCTGAIGCGRGIDKCKQNTVLRFTAIGERSFDGSPRRKRDGLVGGERASIEYGVAACVEANEFERKLCGREGERSIFIGRGGVGGTHHEFIDGEALDRDVILRPGDEDFGAGGRMIGRIMQRAGDG
jgi:hypothetical protein